MFKEVIIRIFCIFCKGRLSWQRKHVSLVMRDRRGSIFVGNLNKSREWDQGWIQPSKKVLVTAIRKLSKCVLGLWTTFEFDYALCWALKTIWYAHIFTHTTRLFTPDVIQGLYEITFFYCPPHLPELSKGDHLLFLSPFCLYSQRHARISIVLHKCQQRNPKP